MLKAVLAGAWFAAISAWERLSPSAARPLGSDFKRWTRNGGLWLANSALSPLITLPIAAWAAQADMWTRPNAANGWIGLGADLLILDLWAYVWHRLNHAWPLLWRFHQVHHRDEFLDATSAVRFHPGEVLISAVARAPIIILTDISFISVLAFETLVLLAAVFHHSNARLPPRIETALCIFVVTPSHHWVHHHAQRADTDSNYGTVLTMWDRLFGSLSATRRSPDMTIGVEGQRDAPLLALAALPFRAGSDQPARNTRAAT